MSNKALFLPGVHGDWYVENRPIPSVEGDKILIRTHALALNPIEWYIRETGYVVKEWPTVIGSDVAGTVVAVGSKVTGIKPGDRVAGHACGAHLNDHDQGGFQEYVVLQAAQTGRMPDNISFEQAAAIPMAITTASGALRDLGVNLPGARPGKQSGTKAILIWGGGSAMGMAAVQFAHSAGATVFTTASPRHHDQLRRLGADYVFDYRSEKIVDELRAASAAAGVTIDKALDAAAADIVHTAEVLKELGGTEMVYLSGLDAVDRLPRDIKTYFSGARVTVADPVFSTWLFQEYMWKELESGRYTTSKIEILPGKLEAIGEGLERLKAGVSGVKLVVKLIEDEL